MHTAHRTIFRRIGSAFLLISLGFALSLPRSLPASAAETFITITTPSRTSVTPGQSLTVEVLLKNETTDRCFGIPQFRLYVETAPGMVQDPSNPIFTPAQPEPIILYTSLGPGDSTRATFTLTAARYGSVTFFATVSGESTGANCQPPYFWASATPSRSTAVTVEPALIYLPIVTAQAID